MKERFKTSFAAFVLPIAIALAVTLIAVPRAKALDAGDLLSFFVSELTPYGKWTNLSPYGRVWAPTDQREWRPYSHGRWIYSDDYGWVWKSNDKWGEVTDHYGRWGYKDNRWFWVPDKTWGPAWVDWRATDDYVGWSALPPDTDWMSQDEWRPQHSYYSDFPNAYVFVPQRYFGATQVHTYSVTPERNREILSRAQDVTVYRYQTHNQYIRNEGPRRDSIERATGHPIAVEHYERHAENRGRAVASQRSAHAANPQQHASSNRSNDSQGHNKSKHQKDKNSHGKH